MSRRFGPEQARILILRVWQEPFDAISENDARAEGFATPRDFINSFREINGEIAPGTIVYAVEFELAGAASR